LVLWPFLSEHTAEGVFEVMVGRFNKTAESIIDEGLIATAPRSVDLLPEPPKNVLVDPNRDPRLARRGLNNGATSPVAEVILLLHLAPSY
jgi:hypothetical protein